MHQEEKQHSNKYVKHFKVRNRDSWPWREDSTSQQDVKQHTQGSGRCNQQPVCNDMKMKDAKKGLTQQRCKTHPNQARKIFFLLLDRHCQDTSRTRWSSALVRTRYIPPLLKFLCTSFHVLQHYYFIKRCLTFKERKKTKKKQAERMGLWRREVNSS